MTAWFVHIGFAIASVFFCATAHSGYNPDFCRTIALCFLVQNILYFLTSGRKNIVGFEFFFAIAFFFVNFAYPLFYYPERENWGFFWFPWDRAVLDRATAIAYLGYTCYMLGLTRWLKMHREEPGRPAFTMSQNQYLLCFLLTAASYILYIAFGGWQAMSEVYNGHGSLRDVGLYSYFYVIFTLGIYLMAVFIYHIPKASWWFYLLTMGTCIVLILATGSRTVVLAVALVLIVGWNNNVRRFRLWEVTLLTAVGVAVLWVIARTRRTDVLYAEQLLHSLEGGKITDVFSDLTINGVNLYILVDYGFHHTSDWFNGMLIDLATPIPGMAGHIVEWTGQPYKTLCAQEMTTWLMLGDDAGWGLGCNMIGDAFRMAKYPGVAVSMFLIGTAVKETYYRSRSSIYSYLIYYLLVSYAVFYTRGPILFPPRVLCWSLLLLWIIRSCTTFDWNTLWERLKRKEEAR